MAVNIKKKAPPAPPGLKAYKASVYEQFLSVPDKKLSGMTVKLHSGSPEQTANQVNLPHKEVVGKTTLQKKVSGQVVNSGHTEETVLKAVATGPNYAKVGCSGGRTMQPVPFESVKIDVWIEVPCPNDAESINEAYDFVSDWVSGKLAEAEEAFKGGSTKTVTVAAYPSEGAKEPTVGGYVKMSGPQASTFMAHGHTITKD